MCSCQVLRVNFVGRFKFLAGIKNSINKIDKTKNFVAVKFFKPTKIQSSENFSPIVGKVFTNFYQLFFKIFADKSINFAVVYLFIYLLLFLTISFLINLSILNFILLHIIHLYIYLYIHIYIYTYTILLGKFKKRLRRIWVGNFSNFHKHAFTH